jgi:hypothetical protein
MFQLHRPSVKENIKWLRFSPINTNLSFDIDVVAIVTNMYVLEFKLCFIITRMNIEAFSTDVLVSHI